MLAIYHGSTIFLLARITHSMLREIQRRSIPSSTVALAIGKEQFAGTAAQEIEGEQMVASGYRRRSINLARVRTEFSIGRETFELHDGDRAVGTMRCQGLLVASGEAETDEGCWTFKPDGILRSRLKICNATTGDVVAIYEGRALRGSVRGLLRFASGRKTRVDQGAILGIELEVRDRTG